MNAELWAAPRTDTGVILVVPLFVVGLVAALLLGIVIGGCAMAGRDRRLRSKMRMGEHHAIKRIALTAIKSAFGRDLLDSPPLWQTLVYVAVVDAEPLGPAAMAAAAVERYGAFDTAEESLRARKLDLFTLDLEAQESILRAAIDAEGRGVREIRRAVLERLRGLRIARGVEDD